MSMFDVIIVGAGPSGSVAAINLAKYGLKTAIIEKETFPRYKSCGDGITRDALNVLERCGLEAWGSQFPPFQGLRFSAPDETIINVPLDTQPSQLMGRTIPRHLFDHELIKTAVKNGAKLIEGTKIESVIYDHDQVSIRSEKQNFSSKILILAEGSNAPLAKTLGLVHDGPELMAARQYLSGDTNPDQFLEIHFQSTIVPGYNWLFPIGSNRINIGTGTFNQRIKNRDISLREELIRFKTDPILQDRLKNTESDSPIEGHPLRTQFGASKTHSSHTLLVGDAAGLVNPFTGVGIGPGLISAEFAAQTICEAFETGNFKPEQLEKYSKKLDKRFLADRKAALTLRKHLSVPKRLNKIFSILKKDQELARLLGDIFFDRKSPQTAYQLKVLTRLL